MVTILWLLNTQEIVVMTTTGTGGGDGGCYYSELRFLWLQSQVQEYKLWGT